MLHYITDILLGRLLYACASNIDHNVYVNYSFSADHTDKCATVKWQQK